MNRKTPMLPEHDIRETPSKEFLEWNAEHRFTLDACASHENTKLQRYYTKTGLWGRRSGVLIKVSDSDGLTGSWKNERVWCNQPYSEIETWIRKAWRSEAELVVMLIPSTRTEQPWWHRYVEPYRDGRRTDTAMLLSTKFLEGRIKFLENGGPIYRKNPDGSVWISERTGEPEISSPKFGCLHLIWRRNEEARN